MKENQNKRINTTSTNQSILYCKVYSQLLVSVKQMNESSASLDLSELQARIANRGLLFVSNSKRY